MTSDLQRCQYCQHPIVEVLETCSELADGREIDGFQAECQGCGASGPIRPTEREAQDAWNNQESHEIARLTAVVAVMRTALEGVILNDKTSYRHNEPRPSDGKRPRQVEGGSIFLTPKEIAEVVLNGWEARDA